jgi:hypothetical protein
LTTAQIEQCINNNLPNASGDYVLPVIGEVPWELYDNSLPPGRILPQFIRLPMSLQSLCSSTRAEIHGLGYYVGSGNPYSNPASHPGIDIFSPVGGDTYSIADSGLIVGIGVEGMNTRSAGNWGATTIQEGIGYSVIVRYGHLYVLYGHLLQVDQRIYAGKKVMRGDRLGEIGTFTGAEPHLHLEVRSFGASIPTTGTILVRDANNANNHYGILANGGSQALNIYDIAHGEIN